MAARSTVRWKNGKATYKIKGRTYVVEKMTLEMVAAPHRETDPQHGDGDYWKITGGTSTYCAFVQNDAELTRFAPELADYLRRSTAAKKAAKSRTKTPGRRPAARSAKTKGTA
jgi:hypothetical protein